MKNDIVTQYGSFAHGAYTTASGQASHAEGVGTVANHLAQNVSGMYNIPDPASTTDDQRGTYIEIVGNGTASTLSNARTLDWEGNEKISGNLTINAGSANEVTITPELLNNAGGSNSGEGSALKYVKDIQGYEKEQLISFNLDITENDFEDGELVSRQYQIANLTESDFNTLFNMLLSNGAGENGFLTCLNFGGIDTYNIIYCQEYDSNKYIQIRGPGSEAYYLSLRIEEGKVLSNEFYNVPGYIDEIKYALENNSNLNEVTTIIIYKMNKISNDENSLYSVIANDLENIAPGYLSYAEGGHTIASGETSHAEGCCTIASGYNSHAEGYQATASGHISHAEGYQVTASGNNSHAEGRGAVASGQASHAEGESATASGDYSHAEGDLTNASGEISHAEGCQATASGDYSHAEGNSTTASGSNSHAEGFQTTASTQASHAEGYQAIASGFASHAEGCGTASGYTSHAEGNNTIASGDYSHAEGSNTTASEQYSHAEGYQTAASEQYSHAEGCQTTASGYGSHAEGGQTVASGNGSHTEGTQTTASGQSAHAEGDGTRALGQYSHVEGHFTKATFDCAHAEGWGCEALHNMSHAEGSNTKAEGPGSHSEGGKTTASGGYSHAEGFCTIAKHELQHVFGAFNVADTSTAPSSERGTYIEIVGNGTSALTGGRYTESYSNARTLDWAGNEQIAGSLTLGMGTTAQVTITPQRLRELLALLLPQENQ